MFAAIFCLIVLVLLIVAFNDLSRSLEIKQIETRGLEPLLDKLYKEPKSKINHDEFLQTLKKLEKQVKVISGGYDYVANKAVFEKLFRHLEKYPTDLLAHTRFEWIVAMTKYIKSEKSFKNLSSK